MRALAKIDAIPQSPSGYFSRKLAHSSSLSLTAKQCWRSARSLSWRVWMKKIKFNEEGVA